VTAALEGDSLSQSLINAPAIGDRFSLLYTLPLKWNSSLLSPSKPQEVMEKVSRATMMVLIVNRMT
jgi:hypothetical protein